MKQLKICHHSVWKSVWINLYRPLSFLSSSRFHPSHHITYASNPIHLHLFLSLIGWFFQCIPENEKPPSFFLSWAGGKSLLNVIISASNAKLVKICEISKRTLSIASMNSRRNPSTKSDRLSDVGGECGVWLLFKILSWLYGILSSFYRKVRLIILKMIFFSLNILQI